MSSRLVTLAALILALALTACAGGDRADVRDPEYRAGRALALRLMPAARPDSRPPAITPATYCKRALDLNYFKGDNTAAEQGCEAGVAKYLRRSTR